MGFSSLEENHWIKNWVVIALILIIILITVIFDSITSLLYKWIHTQNLPTLQNLIKAVFKELTILGFISLFLFVTVQSGLTQTINDTLFGQSLTEKIAIQHALHEHEAVAPPTLLQEIFEDVHILIFLIMVMYILETAILLVIGKNAVKGFTNLDFKTKRDFIRFLEDIKESNSNSSSSTASLNKILLFYGLRERFMSPRIPSFSKPTKRNFPFSTYMSENYSNSLVHMVEIPFFCFLIVLGLCFLIRPLMTLQGISFLYLMVAVAFTLFAITAALEILIHTAYKTLLPDVERLRTFFLNTETSFESRDSTKDLNQSLPTREIGSEVLEAPIDRYQVYSRSMLGITNRIEKQLCGIKMKLCRQCLQVVLFLNAAFLAVVIHDALSLVTKESHLWWKHRMWSYPVTIGVVVVNVITWSNLIQDFVYLSSLDCNTSKKIIDDIEERMEEEAMERNRNILRILLHIAERRRIETSEEYNRVNMERVVQQFENLPKETRNLIKQIFVVLSQYHNQLGEEEIRGIVTKSNIKEALRLMGYNVDHFNSYIMGSWFDKGDKTNEGFLTFSGFVQVLMLSTPLGDDVFQHETETRQERHMRIRTLFETLDTNHDGELSTEEILNILQDVDCPLSKSDVTGFTSELAQGAQTIKYEQFVDFVDYMALTTHDCSL